MLSGPAILRISVLLLIAGALAALVQFLLPGAPSGPVAEPPAARPSEPAPAPATPPPAAPSPPEPAPARTDPAQAARAPAPAAAPTPAPAPADAPPGQQMPADALAFPPEPAAPAAGPSAPAGEAEIARAEDGTGPRALAILDLNTASVAELNRLRGGGAIGRAIVAKRPYASVDQLLTKRVLSRAVYDRIREQVTVR